LHLPPETPLAERKQLLQTTRYFLAARLHCWALEVYHAKKNRLTPTFVAMQVRSYNLK